MKRSNRAKRFESLSEVTQAREALERRWAQRRVHEPRLATLVIAQGSAREPFHRWLPYRQGFSPGLVRLFLREVRLNSQSGIILDPFSGSGTTITECGANRRRAIGIEALPALVFLSNARFERRWIELPPINESMEFEELAKQFVLPLHRAALLIAQARRHTGSGALNRAAPPVGKVLIQVAGMMREDLSNPLAVSNSAICSDARTLPDIEDESIEAVITSPPYLSRYDYKRTNDPIEAAFRNWFTEENGVAQPVQVRAVTRSSMAQHQVSEGLHDCIDEACRELAATGNRQHAATTRAYFDDMHQTLESVWRVLEPGGTAWFVVGGVRLKDVYIPTDLILAELAEVCGFEVDEFRVARDLNPIRRKFGSAGFVAPRESVISLRKA